MDNINFEWDTNIKNINKHNVSFEEAASVFFDENAVLFDDPIHSVGEERFLIIGLTTTSKICIVSHCYRGADNIIRIISARKATKSERDIYFDGI